MTEEQVTKAILKWLIDNAWEIVCFDFPQSGTGRVLHPNNSDDEKNKGAIIPDIVAVKENVCIFLENKDHFYFKDYEKQHSLKTGNEYSNDIAELLKGYEVHKIFYGIGLPTIRHKRASLESSTLVDFIIGVNDDKSVHVLCNYAGILF